MEYALISSTIIGGLLLAFLAAQDYRSQIFKPWKAGWYYAGLVLFLLINLFIYFALCAFFLNVDLLKLDWGGTTINKTRVLQPLILALFYHGTGMAPVFRLGGKEANAYRLLMGSFRDFLKLKFAESIKIREAIAKAQAELSMLRNKATCLHSEAEMQKQDTLNDKWREIENDLHLMDTQADFLKDLKKAVDEIRDNPGHTSSLDEMSRGIDDRIETIRKTEIGKLKQYLADFVLKNFKDEQEIHALLDEIEAPHKIHAIPKPIFALRCMFLGAAFGLALGPLYALTSCAHDAVNCIPVSAVDYARIGALSLGVFGLAMGLVRDLGRNFADRLVLAIVSGAVAGLAGHMTWLIATNTAMDSGVVVGLTFGVVLSLLVYLFRELYYFRLNTLPAWMKATVMRLLLTAMAGATAFVTLSVLFDNSQLPQPEPKTIARMLVLGVIVMWALAAGFKLFDKQPTARKPTSGINRDSGTAARETEGLSLPAKTAAQK